MNMKDIKVPLVFLLLALIITFSCMIIDNYLTNKSKADILIACIQSDNCSESMKQELKPIK